MRICDVCYQILKAATVLPESGVARYLAINLLGADFCEKCAKEMNECVRMKEFIDLIDASYGSRVDDN